MEYTYSINKVSLGSDKNPIIRLIVEAAEATGDGIFKLHGKDNQTQLLIALRNSAVTQSDVDLFAQACADRTTRAGFYKALTVHNNNVVAARAKGSQTTVSARAKARLYAKADSFAIPLEVPISRFHPLQLRDVGRKFSEPTKALLNVWRKADRTTVNGGAVVTWVAGGLDLFGQAKIAFQVAAPPNNPVRDLIELSNFETGKFLMVHADLASIAKRLQYYNRFHPPQKTLKGQEGLANLRGFWKVLARDGIDSECTLATDWDSIQVNPSATIYGVGTYEVDGETIDLAKGVSYKKGRKAALLEARRYFGDELDKREKDKIDKTRDQILLRGKLEVLPVEEVLDHETSERTAGVVIKLLRTFGTGQVVERLAEALLLQPWMNWLKIRAETRRMEGKRAGSISGTTWDFPGTAGVLAYLLYGNSTAPLVVDDLVRAFFICPDRQKMEMTVAMVTRSVLAMHLMDVYKKDVLGAKVSRWLSVYWQQARRRLIAMSGSGHWEFKGGAVISGEMGTYLLDDYDNAYWLEFLVNKVNSDDPDRHIHGGDDGAIYIGATDENYDRYIKEIRLIREKHGILWQDLELRKLCIIDNKQLDDFRQLKDVTTVCGKTLNAMTIHDQPWFTIYGQVPVVVIEDQVVLGIFPVYKIQKILDSWWQPAAKQLNTSADTQASNRAINMNNVIGMFGPVREMFSEWVDAHPTDGAEDLSEFGIQKPNMLSLKYVEDSDTVFEVWFSKTQPTTKIEENTDDWFDLLQEVKPGEVWGDKPPLGKKQIDKIATTVLSGTELFEKLDGLDSAQREDVLKHGYPALQNYIKDTGNLPLAAVKEYLLSWVQAQKGRCVIRLSRQEEDGVIFWTGGTRDGKEVSVDGFEGGEKLPYVDVVLDETGSYVLGRPGVEVLVETPQSTSTGYTQSTAAVKFTKRKTTKTGNLKNKAKGRSFKVNHKQKKHFLDFSEEEADWYFSDEDSY